MKVVPAQRLSRSLNVRHTRNLPLKNLVIGQTTKMSVSLKDLPLKMMITGLLIYLQYEFKVKYLKFHFYLPLDWNPAVGCLIWYWSYINYFGAQCYTSVLFASLVTPIRASIFFGLSIDAGRAGVALLFWVGQLLGSMWYPPAEGGSRENFRIKCSKLKHLWVFNTHKTSNSVPSTLAKLIDQSTTRRHISWLP